MTNLIIIISLYLAAYCKLHAIECDNTMQRDFNYIQPIKFISVGLLNIIIGYGTFFLILKFSNYLDALFLSHIIGVANSYLWNRRWTFKSNKDPFFEFAKFYSIYFIILIINTLTLLFLVNYLYYDPIIGQAFVLPILTIASFIGHKYWSFN